MRLLRKSVFYLFVVLYLVVCPLTICSTLGYVVQPGAERRLIKTGLISLSTAPPGASVYLGRRRYTETTPAILRGLLPGTYEVRLALRHHRPWVQQVAVEAEKATPLEHVLLIPQRLAPLELSAGSWDELISLPGTSVLLLRSGPRLGGVALFDWKAGRGRPLLPAGSIWADARVLALTVMKESPAFLARVSIDGEERTIWAEAAGKEPELEDLTSRLPDPPWQAAWDASDRRYLFVLKGDTLSRLDRGSSPHALQTLHGVLAFGLSRKTLYVLWADGLLQRMGLDGQRAELLLDLRLMGRPPAAARGLLQVEAVADHLLIRSGRGELLTTYPPSTVAERGIQGLEVFPKAGRALCWLKDRLGVLEWPNAAGPDEGRTDPPSLRWLFTKGRRIEQAYWVYEGSHALIQDEDRVLLLALEAPGEPDREPRLQELLHVKAHSSIAYSEESGTLHYLEPASGRLRALELVPQ